MQGREHGETPLLGWLEGGVVLLGKHLDIESGGRSIGKEGPEKRGGNFDTVVHFRVGNQKRVGTKTSDKLWL